MNLNKFNAPKALLDGPLIYVTKLGPMSRKTLVLIISFVTVLFFRAREHVPVLWYFIFTGVWLLFAVGCHRAFANPLVYVAKKIESKSLFSRTVWLVEMLIFLFVSILFFTVRGYLPILEQLMLIGIWALFMFGHYHWGTIVVTFILIVVYGYT